MNRTSRYGNHGARRPADVIDELHAQQWRDRHFPTDPRLVLQVEQPPAHPASPTMTLMAHFNKPARVPFPYRPEPDSRAAAFFRRSGAVSEMAPGRARFGRRAAAGSRAPRSPPVGRGADACGWG
jgi:hypothetical protein